MVSRFISKQINSDLNFEIPGRLTKGQTMIRGRNAALKDKEILHKEG